MQLQSFVWPEQLILLHLAWDTWSELLQQTAKERKLCNSQIYIMFSTSVDLYINQHVIKKSYYDVQ
jgi:hypothetical protein